MAKYTVEVTTRPAAGGDFSAHYRVIDAVPGTVLLEDADEPQLVVPVDADSPLKAAQFVEGLTKLVALTAVSGKIYPTPEVDFDTHGEADDDTVVVTPVMGALLDWVEGQPEFRGRLSRGGDLIDA